MVVGLENYAQIVIKKTNQQTPKWQSAHQYPDQTLRQEAQAYLAKFPALQVVRELVDTLRKVAPPWWTPEILRRAHGASKRF